MTTRRRHRCASGWADNARLACGYPFRGSASPTEARAPRSRPPDRSVVPPRVRLCAVRARSAPLPPSRRKSPSRRRLHRKSLEASSDRRSEWYVALIAVEEHLHFQDILLHGLGCEVAIDGESLQPAEGERCSGLFGCCCIERRP